MTTHKKDCKFCDKTGLLILPLRYSAVVGEAEALGSVPKLPDTLGTRVKDIALTNAKYAPRMMRNGYIYMLTVREGVKYWEGYLVVEGAFLYKFDVSSPPTTTVEFSCETNVCGIDASCIAIPNVQNVSKVYFLFTPTAMTEAKLQEYKEKADVFVGEGKMQAFDPKAWAKAGSRAQEHSLKPELLGTAVPEWMLYQQHAGARDSTLGKALLGQLFPALTAAYEGLPAPSTKEPSLVGRLGILAHKLKQQEGAVFVLHDHIGITQELNDYRNEAVDKLRPWLQIIDPKTGVDNERKVTVLGALDDVKGALENGLLSNQQQAVEGSRKSSEASLNRQLDTARILRQQGRYEEAKTIEANVERSRKVREVNYQRAVADARENAPKAWSKYSKRLPGLEPFRTQFHAVTQTHETTLLTRVDDHLRWLRSAQVVAALDTYDRTHAASGQALQDQVGLAILGMNYTEAGANLVLEWAQAQSINADNLLLRAYCLNQADLEKALASSIASAKEAAAKDRANAKSWWNSLDLIQVNMKNAIDAFDKTNSALESMSANHAFRGNLVGMGAVVYSAMGQAVFKMGLQGQISGGGRIYIGVLAATLGRFNNRVRLSELAHANTAVRDLPDAQRSQGQITRRVREAVETEVTRGKGGDAFKIRAAGVIAFIEGFGLIMRATKAKAEDRDYQTKDYLEITGAGLAIAAAGFEFLGVGVEYVQRNFRSVTLSSRGAAIALGGIKLFAGVLGSFAAGVGMVYDFMDAETAVSKGRKGLAFALRVRGATQATIAILGVVIGYSFCGPLFEFMATRARSQLAAGMAQGLARGVHWLARPAVGATVARSVMLVRVVAVLTWWSIGITILLYVFTDDALEDWCDKSSFRPNPNPKDGFSDVAKELEDLYSAFAEVR